MKTLPWSRGEASTTRRRARLLRAATLIVVALGSVVAPHALAASSGGLSSSTQPVTWTISKSPLTFNKIVCPTTLICRAIGSDGPVAKSTDGGREWSDPALRVPQSMPRYSDVPRSRLVFSSPTTVARPGRSSHRPKVSSGSARSRVPTPSTASRSARLKTTVARSFPAPMAVSTGRSRRDFPRQAFRRSTAKARPFAFEQAVGTPRAVRYRS